MVAHTFELKTNAPQRGQNSPASIDDTIQDSSLMPISFVANNSQMASAPVVQMVPVVEDSKNTTRIVLLVLVSIIFTLLAVNLVHIYANKPDDGSESKDNTKLWVGAAVSGSLFILAFGLFGLVYKRATLLRIVSIWAQYGLSHECCFPRICPLTLLTMSLARVRALTCPP